jgi:L-lysine 2,3-aminomutase
MRRVDIRVRIADVDLPRSEERVDRFAEIIKALCGWTSSLAVLHFVIDAPGGGAKAPLLPEYVE